MRFPGLTNAWIMPIKTRIDMLATGIKTPVGIKVAGPDLEEIERIGRRIEQALEDVPGTRSAYSERVGAGRYIEITPKRREAARLGLKLRTSTSSSARRSEASTSPRRWKASSAIR